MPSSLSLSFFCKKHPALSEAAPKETQSKELGCQAPNVLPATDQLDGAVARDQLCLLGIGNNSGLGADHKQNSSPNNVSQKRQLEEGLAAARGVHCSPKQINSRTENTPTCALLPKPELQHIIGPSNTAANVQLHSLETARVESPLAGPSSVLRTALGRVEAGAENKQNT
jgi:hypothetical protein